MKTIWAFLNAPVIVAFEAAILMAVLVVLGFRNISKALNADDTRANRIVALSKIEIVSFSEAPTSPAEPQKFIGTIKNRFFRRICVDVRPVRGVAGTLLATVKRAGGIKSGVLAA